MNWEPLTLLECSSPSIYLNTHERIFLLFIRVVCLKRDFMLLNSLFLLSSLNKTQLVIILEVLFYKTLCLFCDCSKLTLWWITFRFIYIFIQSIFMWVSSYIVRFRTFIKIFMVFWLILYFSYFKLIFRLILWFIFNI